MAPRRETNREARTSLFIARVIPPIIVGVIAYTCYDITRQVCIDFLIHPHGHYRRTPRVGSGTAIVVIFYVLLILVFTAYLRLWQKVNMDTGYTPRGPQYEENEEATENPNGHRRVDCKTGCTMSRVKAAEKLNQIGADRGSDCNAADKVFSLDMAGLESFYTKDVFVCQEDGRPPYCSKCCQFKIDRAHHCREVDRCVRKMDHFCPWVGGVVSETSFKFFIQFVSYTSMFCIFCLVVYAVSTAELRREEHRVNPHWIVGLALAGFFGLFSSGMALSSLQLAMMNVTTIENLNRKSKVWTLAIRIPDPAISQPNSETEWAMPYPTVTYPPSDRPSSLESQDERYTGQKRYVFAILHTQPGENPFDLGSPFKNFQQVMGLSVLDWFLPFKPSPCADHSSPESFYAFGPVVTKLKKDIGLEHLNDIATPESPP